MFNRAQYFAAVARREVLKAELRTLNHGINEANLACLFEPLSYSQFGEAIKYWYNAFNRSSRAYDSLYSAGKIAWSAWKERYDQFTATGHCDHIYSQCVLTGMDYKSAFIKDWNEGPASHKGGFPIHRSPISDVKFD